MMGRREVAVWLVLSLIWGSTWAAIRIAVTHMPPLRSVALRFALASVILVPVMLFRRVRFPRGREWALLAILAAMMLALPFALIAWTQRHLHSGATSILFATTPILTLWMETWIGGKHRLRRVPRRSIAGTFVGLAGVTFVLAHQAAALKGEVLPALVILLVVAFGSASTIIAKERLKDIPLLTVAAMETLIAAAIVGVLSLMVESGQPTVWTPSTILAMLFLGAFSSAFGSVLFYWLLLRIEPYHLAARYLLMPIIAVAEGALFLHEPISSFEVAGGIVVFVSLVLLLSSDRRVHSTSPRTLGVPRNSED